jgi:hypothetical protein
MNPFFRSSWFRQTATILLAGICFWPGQLMPFSVQMSLFESLRTTAGIIFGVVGAWIAVMYPHALSKIFKLKAADSEEEVKKVSRLFEPMVYSTVILMVVLLAGPLGHVAKQLAFLVPYTTILRGLSFGAIIYLTLIQMWSLLLILSPPDMVNAELRQIIEHKSNVESYENRIHRSR